MDLQIKKILWIFVFCAIMPALGGCNTVKEKTVEMTTAVLLTEYSEKQMLMIGLSQVQDIRNVYTDRIWEQELNGRGVTYKSFFMGEMKSFFKELLVLNRIAEEKGVRLTADEATKVSAVASAYYQQVSQKEGVLGTLSHEEVDRMFKDYAVAVKTKNEVTKEEVDSVSEDDARIFRLQQIVLDSQDAAAAVEEKLKEENADFYTIARQNSVSSEINITVGHEDLCAAADASVSELEDGKVSEIIEDQGKFYIYKCLDGYDEEATAKKKRRLKEEKKEDALRIVYHEYLSRHEVEVDPQIWEVVEQGMESELGESQRSEDQKEKAGYNFFALFTKEFGDAGL